MLSLEKREMKLLTCLDLKALLSKAVHMLLIVGGALTEVTEDVEEEEETDQREKVGMMRKKMLMMRARTK